MINDFVTSLEHTLKNEFPNKSESIKIYNSFQADNIKEYDMKNILEEWSKLDCVLSTPTIEAGVSYDCERFDKIYGVISDGSCSQRSYFQMMARIRKIKDKEIIILNNSNMKNNKCHPWNFEEVKQGLILNGQIRMKTSTLSSFQNNYIFNRVEELNKQKYFFLNGFVRIAKRKGFQVEVIDKKHKNSNPPTPDNISIATRDTTLSTVSTLSKGIINDNISHAVNIDKIELADLKKRQKRSKLTRDEHYKLAKHYLKVSTGLDEVNSDIVKTFRHRDIVYNFACLINDNNEKCKDQQKHQENLIKLNYMRNMINMLGYQNAFDKTLIKADTFEINIRKVIDYLIDEYKK